LVFFGEREVCFRRNKKASPGACALEARPCE
jgi:hypothetical protein